MNSKQIEYALAQKHRKDFWLRQVKNGTTWMSCDWSRTSAELRGEIIEPLCVLDFWAMKKTWTKYDATGYEIKVSRSDFKADNKWEGYLKYCTRFYFACPSGLIKKDELPPEIGLVWITPQLTCHTIRGGQFTPRDPDPNFLRYILMHRVDCEHLPKPEPLNYEIRVTQTSSDPLCEHPVERASWEFGNPNPRRKCAFCGYTEELILAPTANEPKGVEVKDEQ